MSNVAKKLFISYSHKDEKKVEDVFERLKLGFNNMLFDIWIDKTHLPGGVRLFETIENGIRESDIILLFISTDYCGSQSCREEFFFARREGKKRIPIKLEKKTSNGIGLATSEITSINAYYEFPSYQLWFNDLWKQLAQSIQNIIQKSIDVAPNVNIPNTPVKQECAETKFLKSFEIKADRNISFKDTQPNTLCQLPNGDILICSGSYLTLFDKAFCRKTHPIDTLNNMKIYCNYATTNNKDKIYLTNTVNHQVIVTDLSLNFIKSIGSFGKAKGEFMNPLGILYHENLIYVCDSLNSRIQVFDGDLKYKNEHNDLEFAPITIQIIEMTICIKGRKKIAFYDFNFDLISDLIYDRNLGCATALNKNFYEYIHDGNQIFCYNSTGEAIDEFDDKCFKDYIANEFDGQLVKLNNCIYFLSSSKCELVFLQEVQ